MNDWLKHMKRQAAAEKPTRDLARTPVRRADRQEGADGGISRAEYITLAAVPAVPEGVDVPADLLRWRSPTCPTSPATTTTTANSNKRTPVARNNSACDIPFPELLHDSTDSRRRWRDVAAVGGWKVIETRDKQVNR